MAEKNVSITVTTQAWDTANNTRKTGDAANITAEISQEGAKMVAADNSVTEILRVDNSASGRYKLTLTADEMDADDVRISFWSSTADIEVEDVHIVTQELEVEIPEPTAGAPSATPTRRGILALLWAKLTNKQYQANDELTVYNSAGTAIMKQQVSSDDTTTTKERFTAP